MAWQLLLTGALFALMGVGALVAPERVVAPFGIRAKGADARNEVRAVYGGFGVAMGALLLGAEALPDARDGIVLTSAVALLGMAFGRGIAAAIERPGRWPWVFAGVEIVLGAVLISALA